MRFAEDFQKTRAPRQGASVFWIGQAGFALKTGMGQSILIDPYLTDSVHESLRAEYGMGFKRLSPALFAPQELQPDYLLISHEHGDHLDTGAVAALCGPHTRCLCSEPCVPVLTACGVPEKQIRTMRPGDRACCGDFICDATMSNHGPETPGTLGFLIRTGEVCIYYSGDTCLDEAVIAPVRLYRPTLALLPVNGAFGNLNGEQAAEMAASIGARLCVPHHFWTFPLHYGDPMEAVRAFEEKGKTQLVLLTPGERLDLEG